MVYIVIEGVIGVGKTALTRLLGEQFSMHTFFERFEDNPFLNSLTCSKTPNSKYGCLLVVS